MLIISVNFCAEKEICFPTLYADPYSFALPSKCRKEKKCIIFAMNFLGGIQSYV